MRYLQDQYFAGDSTSNGSCELCGKAFHLHRQYRDKKPPHCPSPTSDGLDDWEDLIPIGATFQSGSPLLLGRPVEIKRALLGFRLAESEFCGEPQRAFRAEGLMVWNAPEGATIAHCHIGLDNEILCSAEPVPARFFSTAKSYEEVVEQLKGGNKLATWCTFRAAIPGERIRLTLWDKHRAPLTDNIELVMWGTMLRE